MIAIIVMVAIELAGSKFIRLLRDIGARPTADAYGFVKKNPPTNSTTSPATTPAKIERLITR